MCVIEIFTTGGTIDKVYFDALSEYQIGPTAIIDMLRDKAVFSVFRKATEFPLYRIEKTPQLARKQGAYCVIAAGGLVMKRGHDLRGVLRVLESRLEVVGT